MNDGKNKGRGIFYGVIGVATLVVAIIGATFAYFTATAGNNNTITGNMASVSLGIAVNKVTTVDQTKGGMIPMSNGMVEQAISGDGTTKSICVDDNGNAVCQIYKITVTNNSTAGVFVDGYVALTGGSGVPSDYTTWKQGVSTTMRWAQVFCTDQAEGADGNSVSSCSTAGTQILGAGTGESKTFTALGNTTNGLDAAHILESDDDVLDKAFTISGNTYDAIKTNYIRVSNHVATTLDANNAQSYSRDTDLTSALVFSRNIAGKAVGAVDGVTDSYYIVVWLSETGTNQTVGAEGAAASNDNFFGGNVTFISAEGSEVSATFSGYTRVPTANTTENP